MGVQHFSRMESSALLAFSLRTVDLVGLPSYQSCAPSIMEIIGEELSWDVTQKGIGDGICSHSISTFYDFLFLRKATPTL